MASLSGKNLSCLRGDRLIFQGLSFAVQQGQTLILTGANGSGKTSLLRLMAGLLDPFAGEIKRDGNILWLGQETPLKPQLTVLENLQFLSCAAGDGVDGKNRPVTELRFPRKRESLFSWALRSPLSRGRHKRDFCNKSDIRQALKKSGLGHIADYPASYLSMGQRRRAVLTLLHLVKRDIWLLDEPTNHLDRESCDRLIETIAAHTKQGGIAVIATHSPELWSASAVLDISSLTKDKREAA